MPLYGFVFLTFTIAVFPTAAQHRYSYKCFFESGLCSFLRNSEWNRENWKIGRENGDSKIAGLPFDHTLGTANGSYLYVNGSAASTYPVQLKTTILNHPYCVRFFYHMYGEDVGELSVFFQSLQNSSEMTKYFSHNGTQGDLWKEAVFGATVSRFMRYRVVFSALYKMASSKVRGHIALDDVEMAHGECPDTKSTAETLCSFDTYDCGYRVTTGQEPLGWEWKTEKKSDFSYRLLPPVDHTLGTTKGGYWFSATPKPSATSRGVVTSSLISPEYPVPKQVFNCLHFYYYIEVDRNHGWYGTVEEAFIQVHASFSHSADTLLVTKSESNTNHRQWTYVEAKVELPRKYQLNFTVGLDSSVESLIALDDVKLIPGHCPQADFCDFETDTCRWIDGEGDYFWVRKRGDNNDDNETGPITDKTTETRKGHCIVASTANQEAGSKAVIESEIFPPTHKTLCLSFYYDMKGKNVGTLKVVQRQQNATELTLWVLKGHRVETWTKGKVPVRPSASPFQVVFQSVAGTESNGFMALDDVRIRFGEKCDHRPPAADPLYEITQRMSCSFDDRSLCSWKEANDTLPWKFGNSTLTESTAPKEPLSGKGHFVFIASFEANQRNKEKVARLVSPVVSFSYPEPACISFYYHMFGARVGELRLVLVRILNEHEPLERKVIWRRSGTQPDKWLKFQKTLNFTEGNMKLEIEGEGGKGFIGNIAVDEVSLMKGACPDQGLCHFESGLCGWTVEPSAKGTFYWRRGASLGKGPIRDHTTMSASGFYLQAFSEVGTLPGDQTNFVSPISMKLRGPHCLTFWYYRPGVSTGRLSVGVREGQKGKLHIMWIASKYVGQLWRYGQVNVDAKFTLQLVFQAVKGRSDDYQMAVDDIFIQKGMCRTSASCDFNSDYCGYYLDDTSDFAWLLGTGTVANSPDPSDSIDNGMYVYADMTSASLKENQSAVLVSEILEAPPELISCVSFSYYMNGEDKANLVLGKMVLHSTEEHMQDKKVKIFSANKPTGLTWFTRQINLPSVAGETYQIFFAAIRGKGGKAFVSIDDISWTRGRCPGSIQTDCLPVNEHTEGPPLSEQAEDPLVKLFPEKHCAEGQKLCGDGKTCIPGLLRCDGVKDCPDGSDEIGCERAKLCPADFYFCMDWTFFPCLPRENVCNGVSDCSDGSDESACDACLENFCLNRGNCSVIDRRPVCQCQPGYLQNRCANLKVASPIDEELPSKQAFVTWIAVFLVLAFLLGCSVFVICYKRRCKLRPPVNV